MNGKDTWQSLLEITFIWKVFNSLSLTELRIKRDRERKRRLTWQGGKEAERAKEGEDWGRPT